MTPLILLVLATAPVLLHDIQATPAPAPVEPKWTGSVSLGLSYSDGNTRRRTASASVDAEYRREKDRTTLGLLWNYAEEQTGISDRKTQGRVKYDYFFSKRVYGLLQASGESDYRSALDLRTTIGAGLGRQFEDSATWKLSGELGVSYVNSDFKGTADDTDYLAGRAAYTWNWKPNPKYELGQLAEIFPSLETMDDVNARVDTKGRMNLTDKMFAQLEWIYQWDNTPAAGKLRVDDLVLFGLGWSF
jgi:putative salt-induced outer membrane protein YdiY